MLDHVEGSAGSWREKFEGFIEFLTKQCSDNEREPYLDAVLKPRLERSRLPMKATLMAYRGKLTVANVREATGRTKRETRARLMHSFNTPFFPEIFVCSEVMGEGVDLQRFVAMSFIRIQHGIRLRLAFHCRTPFQVNLSFRLGIR
jgi:hypothetical protein